MIKRLLLGAVLALLSLGVHALDLNPTPTPAFLPTIPMALAPQELALNYVGITQAPLVSVSVTCPPSIASCGTITSSPAGINCPGTCSYAFVSGTSVTLTTTSNGSNASSTVYGTGTAADGNWGGTGSAATCTSTAATSVCSFTFNQPTTAAASFAPKDNDVWWVGKAGADSVNDCRSRATACLTINHALSLITGGDTVYVDDGTYSESLGAQAGQQTSGVINTKQGTAFKRTRLFAYNPNQAIVDPGYVNPALYIWKASNYEVAYFKFLHGGCQIDGSSNENGGGVAVLTPVFNSGILTGVTVTAGGSGYSSGSTWLGAFYGGSGTGASYSITTNGSGVITSTAIISGGSGYGTGTGVELYPSLRVSNVYWHDFGCGMASLTGGSSNTIGSNSCNQCVFENLWGWGYGGRYVASHYHCAHCEMRRVIGRYDGSTDENTNPRAVISVYDDDDIYVENNAAIDFSIGTDALNIHAPYFTTCSNPTNVSGGYPFGLGKVGFFGNITTNNLGNGDTVPWEIDSACSTKTGLAGSTAATLTMSNNSIGKNSGSPNTAIGIWFERDVQSSTNGGAHTVIFDHNGFYDLADTASTGRIMRIDNGSGTAWAVSNLQNSYFESPDFSTIGCFQNLGATITTSADNFRISCSDTRYTTLPGGSATNPGVKYLLRCEGATYGTASAACTGAASDGGDVGPTIVNRYLRGTLTGTALWPWPNEAEARNDFCRGPDDVSSDNTTTGTKVSVASGSDSTVAGHIYYIATAGTINWTSIGASSSALGTRFTRNSTAMTGSGGAVGPNVYTRGHNVSASMLCGGSKTITAYIWEQLGNPSPY